VIDNIDAPGADVFTGGAAPKQLADNMHGAWVAFAKSGDPSIDALPEWPRYDTDRRATMLLEAQSTLADDPDGDMRRVWDGLF
jgi:para-nitrobenzyl esterase